MAISSYPRTIQVGQNAINGNSNSGTGLMLFDSTTNKYIAATPQTFAGAAGGATAANQTTQINVANDANVFLSNLLTQIQDSNVYLASLDVNITNLLAEIISLNATILQIRDNQTNQTQITKIVAPSGNFAEVNGSNQLTVTTTT